MFSDGLLGDDGYQRVLRRFPDIGNAGSPVKNNLHQNRANVFAARYSEALASLVKKDTFLVVLKRDGAGNEAANQHADVGAYQTEWVNPKRHDPPPPNIWLTYEFPALQRNENVPRVLSVDVSNNFHQDVDWINPKYRMGGPQHGGRLLNEGHADDLEVPPPTDLKTGQIIPPSRMMRRQESECPSETTSGPASSITSPTKLVCSVQDGDPTDFAHENPACICSQGTSTATLSQLSTGSGASRSALCAYSSLPTGSRLPTPTLPVTTTNCQICIQVNINEDNCRSISGCTMPVTSSTPTAPATGTPSTIVQVSKNSIHVGNHAGSQLYTET